MNDRLRGALARRIESHNRLVKLTSLWSGSLLIVMWVVIYAVSYWVVVFLFTIVHGTEAEPPHHFWIVFAVASALWILVAWVDRIRSGDGARGERTLGGALFDIFLAPPRATLAAIANFRSRVVFTEVELDQATNFLERMGRAGKIPLDSIEAELPDEGTREHILESLQSIDLVCARRSRNGEHLCPANPQSLVRFLQ